MTDRIDNLRSEIRAEIDRANKLADQASERESRGVILPSILQRLRAANDQSQFTVENLP